MIVIVLPGRHDSHAHVVATASEALANAEVVHAVVPRCSVAVEDRRAADRDVRLSTNVPPAAATAWTVSTGCETACHTFPKTDSPLGSANVIGLSAPYQYLFGPSAPLGSQLVHLPSQAA